MAINFVWSHLEPFGAIWLANMASNGCMASHGAIRPYYTMDVCLYGCASGHSFDSNGFFLRPLSSVWNILC